MKKTNFKKNKIKGLMFLFLFLISLLMMSIIPAINDNQLNSIIKNDNIEGDDLNEDDPKLSLPTSNYEWWNKSWNFRIPVDVSSTGEQVDAPVELYINFSEYFNNIGVENPWLNKYSIRVIEYTSISDYTEIDCEFEPWSRSYDNETNAVGEVIWILNGTTPLGTTREFFIYFNNGSVSEVPYIENNIRIWHQGFEEYQVGDIQSGGGSQDTYPTSGYWEISNTTSARGRSSLHMWGNCWKVSYTGGLNIDSNTRVTAKMRFDDSNIDREISGLGIHNAINPIPDSSESYNIRGHQAWGSAESYKYRNQYFTPNTFFWYTMQTFDVQNTGDYIFYIADDDSYTNKDLYWDDISVWSQTVQTVPDHMLTINTGDVEPITFSLKVITKDKFGDPVPNAHIYIKNNTQESMDQNHTTNEDGEWNFVDIEKDGIYNITINYTQNGLDSPKTETVYYYENYQIQKLSNEIITWLNLTTFNFNVTDNDGDPIQYGYVLLKDRGTSMEVGKVILNEYGNGTIRWINETLYDYEVYYDYNLLPDASSYRYVGGILKINDTTNADSANIDVLTKISKVYFNVTERIDQIAFVNAKLRFYNETDYPTKSEIIANVTVQADGSATFISFGDNFGDWGDYTVDVYFAGQEPNFWINDTFGPYPDGFNFTLNKKYDINMSVIMVGHNYNTSLSSIYLTDDISWGSDITITFNFTRSEPGVSNELTTPDEIYLQILDGEFDDFSSKVSLVSYEITPNGVFNYTFNTRQFSLIGNTYYFIEITGTYQNFVNPEPLLGSIYIQPLPTGMSIHDYDSLNPITMVSEFYNEKVNITVQYCNESLGALKGARLSYDWQFGSGDINPDPRNDNYYTFEIDAGVTDAGTYLLEITAMLENYTTQENNYIFEIMPRLTSINNETDPLDKTVNIYIQDALNFTFEYRDVLTTEILGDLDQAYYKWYKMSGGSILQGPSDIITLLEREDKVHVLDFSTDTKLIGTYLLRITLVKTNYETKALDITLNILKREIDADLDAKGLDDDQLNIVKGKTVTIEIELTDPTQGDIPITGAKVVLEIGDKEFEFDEKDDGVYKLKFSTEDYEAFFTSQTLTGEIIIKKANYETEEIDITIVIEMEEITPGIPTFYFIMVVGAVAAVVGSLVTYRVIQLARIPKFIKKARVMKKAIKGRGEIPDSALTSSKEEMILKQFGDDWKELGISLGDTLGIKPKKGKILSESKESMKTEGGVK